LNNFFVFNPTHNNMMTDVDYQNNAQRQNGLQSGIASSQLHNKLFYQVSAMVYALAAIVDQAGLVANDSDIPALIASLKTVFAAGSGGGDAYITDTVTGLRYAWGIANGIVFLEEVA